MDPHYQELCHLLFEAHTDSKKLLQLEQNINFTVNSAQTNNILTLLTRALVDATLDSNVKFIAAVVLKNTLRNHLLNVSENELSFVKDTLM